MTPPDRTETNPTHVSGYQARYQDWRGRVEAELGPGRDFERSLVTKTLEGLGIAPLYVADASRPAPSFEIGSGGWTIATEIAHPSAKHANADLLGDLTEGATGLCIRLGSAAKGLGDQAQRGSSGVDIEDLGALDRLLDGVYLDAIPIAFESNANALPLAATFAALCQERGVDLEDTRVEFGMDPIGALARDGALPGDMEDARRELCQLAGYSRIKLNHGRSIAIDASVWHRAGGHAAQELGFALATFVQYLRWLEDDGLAPAQAHVEFVWRFDVGRDVFTEIAKLRAARELCARVLGAMGIEECAPMKLSVTTSPRGLAKRDPWTNMLRTSLGVFAGATGGADMITALPFDTALGLPSPLGRRNARNTQLVLAHESRLEHVGDPARGAYYVEERTNGLCEAAWSVFLAVEEEGGMVKALDSDWVAGELDRSRADLHEAIAHRRWPLVGVSEYPGASLELDPDREAAEGGAIEAARAATATRLAARGTVSIGAIDDFPHAREAARQGATIEEIGDALVRGARQTMRAVPGFREASVFERLVEAAEALPEPPRVFLACLGPLARHTARAGFATQLLLAGGFEVVQSEPDLTPAQLGAAAKAAGATLVCLAGSDDDYGSDIALEALASLRDHGAREVWIAAPPERAAKPLEEAGLDGHIFMGCDAEAALSSFLKSAGADLAEVSR
ncbi:Methylmalonyl-CoA mutase small subunit [Planctomycetes bacterium Poly30]|uniref:Methylmalonyl-CoA mutase small subunit n=1 Tax=Saltatorellus ferox TaxID=2528018 RepID=A0A518EZU4_9BACT|nr:Methylmalonyl-CoA mutase small subunit [Planctomycetes bacterium Poly30]